MQEVIYVGLLVVSALVVLVTFFLVWKADKSELVQKHRERDDESDEDGEDEREGLRRRRGPRADGRGGGGGIGDAPGDADGDDPLARALRSGKKIGKKKMAKLEAKAAARREREALEQIRIEEKRKREALLAQSQLEQEEALEMQRREAEEEKLRQAALEQRKQEEFDEWKDMFSVDDVGTEALNDEEKQQKLREFISFVKERKIVMLEDLGAMFGMKTADVLERLQSLDSSGEMTCVIDDRGKVIYLEESELKLIAAFVERRGRLTQDDINLECNRVIDLDEAAGMAALDLDDDVEGEAEGEGCAPDAEA